MEASRSSSTEALAAARRRALCDRPVLPLTTGSLMLILMPMADGARIQPSLIAGVASSTHNALFQYRRTSMRIKSRLVGIQQRSASNRIVRCEM